MRGILPEGHEAPLHSRGEARAAPPAQIRLLDRINDFSGRHLQGLSSALVTPSRLIDFQIRCRSVGPNVLREWSLVGHGYLHRSKRASIFCESRSWCSSQSTIITGA